MFKYNMSLIAHAQLSVAILSSDLELEVMPGEGVEFTQPPCIGVLSRSRSMTDLRSAEHIKITDRTSDVLTIERAVIGTAQAWPAGTLLLGYWSPEHLDSAYRSIDMIEFLLSISTGGGLADVVIYQTDKDFTASAGSGLAVALTPGACFANYKLFAKSTPSALSFIAPTVSTRYDLIQADAVNGIISVKTGVEGGSAPSADTGCCPLWQVRTVVGQTTRISGDLTDVRPS